MQAVKKTKKTTRTGEINFLSGAKMLFDKQNRKDYISGM